MRRDPPQLRVYRAPTGGNISSPGKSMRSFFCRNRKNGPIASATCICRAVGPLPGTPARIVARHKLVSEASKADARSSGPYNRDLKPHMGNIAA